MKLNGRWLIVYIIALIAFIQGVYGIQITASGGGNGESGSVAMNFDTLKSTAVSSQIAINGATITPSTAIAGPIAEFKQTHWIKDTSGKSASVYVKVLNAPLGLTYTSKVLPKEGNVATLSQVSAEQWLTVPKADSIKCTATASYGTTRSASVGLEEYKNSLIAGDYVTLTGYYGKALTTGTLVSASQTATSGAANSIKIYGTSKDSSGTYRVDTPLKGISGGKATFTGLSETSLAGTTTQVVQKEHVHGAFTSTATYTPTTGTAKTKTRTSNYGTEYDINMKAAKGSVPTGTLGYYVKPGTTASKIQGAVNAAALSGDTINVAAGTYKENVKIDKSLAVKGAGSTKTIVDGNKAGSVFSIGTVYPNVNVALSDIKIQNGAAAYGGGIYNSGTATITGSTISDNTGGGIYNEGTATITGSTISDNTGGGIRNPWTSAMIIAGMISRSSGGILTIQDSKITGNTATRGGGIDNGYKATIIGCTISGNSAKDDGGGIWNEYEMKTTSSTIWGNTAGYGGGGIWNEGIATIAGSTISGNTARYGGGIFNTDHFVQLPIGGYWNNGVLTVTGSTISGNSAGAHGGGISSIGTLVIKKGSYIFANIADSDADGFGKGGGIYSSTPIFKDQYGNIITDPIVINSIVYNNHLKSNTGPLSNIEH